MSSKNNKSRQINILTVVTTIVIFAIYYYVSLPVINIHSTQTWTMLIGFVLVFLGANLFWRYVFLPREQTNSSGPSDQPVQPLYLGDIIKGIRNLRTVTKVGLGIIAGVLVIMLVGELTSTYVFRASTYANLITVNEADFKEDMPETNEVTDIALMDTSAAAVLGTRALGNLSDVVSQYLISTQYSQINYENSPQKVANLEYNGFFKWFNNRKNGVPGYVMVDPVKNTAKYVELDTSLKYVSSGYFNDKLERKLRFSYPTKIFDGCYFEIDEDGNPYFIVSCLSPNAGLFGAMDVSELIIFNPCDGSSDIYAVEDVPAWVDTVYTGTLACQKYNWQGMLSGGFINSFIGQKGCKQTTQDYGFIIRDDDVWYYTGVTSVIADESNIGFILTNARTGEYKYYSVVGAEEYSAMGAAEGEVQEKGYKAAFPCLINVADQPTYIMVLKDSNSLVKLYALVNVENYSFVVTAETQAEAVASYKKLLIRNNIIPEDTEIIELSEIEKSELDIETETVAVTDVRFAVIDGESYIYLLTDDGKMYKAQVSDDETVMLITAGNEYEIYVADSDDSGISTFYDWALIGPVTEEEEEEEEEPEPAEITEGEPAEEPESEEELEPEDAEITEETVTEEVNETEDEASEEETGPEDSEAEGDESSEESESQPGPGSL